MNYTSFIFIVFSIKYIVYNVIEYGVVLLNFRGFLFVNIFHPKQSEKNMNENNKDEKKNNYVMTSYYRRILLNQSQTYLLSHTKKKTITYRSEK